MKDLHMNDLGRVIGIPVANGTVLAITFFDGIKDILQISLLALTIAFTTMQLIQLSRRLRREQKLMELVAESQSICWKAKEGDCPLKKKLES